MRKFIILFSFIALAVTIMPTQVQAQASGYCVEPKGELLGTINHLRASGFEISSIECQQVSYLVPPTPPFLNRVITVTMQKVSCPTPSGPCILLGTAVFTADEIVQNQQGALRYTNISDVIVAL